MVQNCIIALINHCHQTDISLEPLITGSGHGGHNFSISLFTYFSHLLRGSTTARNEFQPRSSQDTLINLAKSLYNHLELARVGNLMEKLDDDVISFEIDYEDIFEVAATQLDVQLSRIVRGSITQLVTQLENQLEHDILSADRHAMIEAIKQAKKQTDFQP